MYTHTHTHKHTTTHIYKNVCLLVLFICKYEKIMTKSNYSKTNATFE